MRSERGGVGRFLPVLVLAALLTTNGGCRRLVEPGRETGSPASSYRLVLDVIAPEGVEVSTIDLGHDNSPWFVFGDSLRRFENRDVPDSGRLVFENLVEGPTLLEYDWYSPSGESRRGTWGVVVIPSPPLVLDFSQSNLTLFSRLTEQGEPLSVERTVVELRGRLGNTSLFDSHYTRAESLSVWALAGAWRVDSYWEFRENNALNRISMEWADSVRVPDREDLSVDFSRFWLELRLGGERLRNASVYITLVLPESDRWAGARLAYRPRALTGEPIPVLHGASSFRLEVQPSAVPFGSSLPFPWRRIWTQTAPGDTLRLDLAEHRVRLRVSESGQPVAFVPLLLEAQRADTGGLTLTTDDVGEATGWLPQGSYRAGLDSPHFSLAHDRIFHVSSDTLIQWEVIPR